MKTVLSHYLPFGVPTWRFSIARIATHGFRFTNQWLGLIQVTQRPWSSRIPAVLAAGVFLTVYLWMGGFSADEIRWVLAMALFSLALAVSS